MAMKAPSAATEAQRSPILPLAVRDLVLRFGDAAVLDGVSLDPAASGCTMILGPSGAGKSLLLKLLHGRLQPTEGQVLWGRQSATDVTARQALVFQKPVLLRWSVAANIDFVLKARGKDRARRDAMLDHVGLAHKADQPARLLSGGEAQRLALARALATDPEVMFLDEPTARLDPASVLAIERIVSQARDSGVRIIFVTHDRGQARRMAGDVVFVHRGRVAEHSPAADFFPEPRCVAARDYLNGRIVVRYIKKGRDQHACKKTNGNNGRSDHRGRRLGAGSVDHRPIDHIYGQLGSLRLPLADFPGGNRHTGQCRGRRHRSGDQERRELRR
jgi:tungstate transport system ATP-binding protein